MPQTWNLSHNVLKHKIMRIKMNLFALGNWLEKNLKGNLNLQVRPHNCYEKLWHSSISSNHFGSHGKWQQFLAKKGQRLSNWQPEFNGNAESCEVFIFYCSGSYVKVTLTKTWNVIKCCYCLFFPRAWYWASHFYFFLAVYHKRLKCDLWKPYTQWF